MTKYMIEEIRVNNFPFIVHASSMDAEALLPTHTHGLDDVGFPNYIINPLAFGPRGNANLIAASYDYFKKSNNANKLRYVLNGKVIELTDKELQCAKKGKDRYAYCYRLVPHDFEAIKMAYDISEIRPNTKFVQIWVKGDDYVLEDEYYKGGIMW